MAPAQLSARSIEYDRSRRMTTSSGPGPPTEASAPPRTNGRAKAATNSPSAASRITSNIQWRMRRLEVSSKGIRLRNISDGKRSGFPFSCRVRWISTGMASPARPIRKSGVRKPTGRYRLRTIFWRKTRYAYSASSSGSAVFSRTWSTPCFPKPLPSASMCPRICSR